MPSSPSSHARTPLDHLEGVPPFLMMQMEARLKVRIREILNSKEAEKSPLATELVDEVAHDILWRMMRQRMRDGKQFDSILEASRNAFAKAMFLQWLGKAGDA